MNPLEQAIEKIEGGWCAGDLNRDGKVCAVGAIAAVELDVDMRLIDRAKFEDMNLEERKALYAAENGIYESVDKLKSARVLADEIIASGWTEEYLSGVYLDEEHKESCRAIWAKEPSDLILTYNDTVADQSKVMEMFKFAAKRYDEPE